MKRWFGNSRLQRFLPAVVLMLLVFAGLSAGSDRVLAQNSPWEAKYWNNRTLSGEPILVRQENSINWDWGSGSPDAQVFTDNFSAQWRQTVNLPAGTYRFSATMDDGMRVWVDNTVIIDQWFDSQVRTVTADVFLGAGNHTIQVQYYEAGGQAVAKVSYAAISAPPPPASNAWRGEFFNNTNLSGTPVVVADTATVNFDWGFGSPGVGIQNDNFSARFTRTVNLDPGKYRITVTSDDGVRLWVNNNLVIDQWRVQAARTFVVDVDASGQTAMRLEYFEATERAQIRLDWVRISGGVTPPPPPTGAWRAEYYNNTSLAGAPVVTRNEASINYNWGLGSPDPQIQADNFSARWTTTIPTATSRYRFTATSDDGIRVWVNDRLIIDAWFDRPVATFTGEIDLVAGSANVRVEYYERVNLAEARVSYQAIGGSTGGQFPGTATVIAYYLNVRSGPGVEFPVVFKLSRGQVVALTGFRNPAATWIQIVTPNGGSGWVNASYTTTSIPVSNLTPIGGTTPPPQPPPQPPSTGVTGTVTSSYLNVRTGPSTGFPAFTSVRNGTVVPLLGRNHDSTWVKGILPDGRQGWMSAFFMAFNTGIKALPVLTQ